MKRTHGRLGAAVVVTLCGVALLGSPAASVASRDLEVEVTVDCSHVAVDDCPDLDGNLAYLVDGSGAVVGEADVNRGTLDFPDVAPGNYTVTFEDEHSVVRTPAYDFVGDEGAFAFTYVPEPSAVVEATVAGPAGEPVAMPSLTFVHTDGSDAFSADVTSSSNTGVVVARTRAYGTFVLRADDRLTNGYLPTYYPDSLDLADATPVTLQPGTHVELPIAVHASGLVEGTLGAVGNWYHSTRVEVYDTAGHHLLTTGTIALDDARYRIAGLRAGTYLLQFAGDDTHPAVWYRAGSTGALTEADATPVDVTEGQTTSGIDIDPSTCGSISGTLRGYTSVSDAELGGYKGEVQAINVNDPVATRVGSLDGDLRYTVKGLAPGRYRVAFLFHGYLTDGGDRRYYWHGDTTSGDAITVASCADARTGVDMTTAVELVTRPVITGRPVVGQTLAVTAGTWTLPATVAYQWTRDGAPIDGATTSRHAVVAADAGHRIAVSVIATRHWYEPATSAAAGVAVAVQPRLVSSPDVTGTYAYGHTLRVTTGTWSPAAKSAAYQWFRDGHAITGATAATYRITRADIGRTVFVRVRVTTSAGGWAVATGAPITQVPKVRPKVAISYVDPTITRSQHARLRVKVTDGGVVTPAGTLAVRLTGGSGKTIKVTLHASSHGSTTIKLPRLPGGTTQARVTFKPASSQAAYVSTATSSRRTVHVR